VRYDEEFLYVGYRVTDDEVTRVAPKGFAGKAQRTQTGFTAELWVPLAYLDHVYGSEWQDFRINASYMGADPQGSKVRNYDWQPKWEQNLVGTGLFFRTE
jgi:hypothetical protein